MSSVWRAVVYLVASWLVMQIADVRVSLLGLPAWTGKFVFQLVITVMFVDAYRLWFGDMLTEEPAASVEDMGVASQTPVAAPQYPPNSIAVLSFVNTMVRFHGRHR